MLFSKYYKPNKLEVMKKEGVRRSGRDQDLKDPSCAPYKLAKGSFRNNDVAVSIRRH